MSSTGAAYLGFLLFALIVIGSIVELSGRYAKRKKIDARDINSWVMLDPSLPSNAQDPSFHGSGIDQEVIPNLDLHLRAQQNGHSLESKKST